MVFIAFPLNYCAVLRIFAENKTGVNDFLNTKIEFLKGVGSKRAELLNKELGIITFGDLLEYYPFRYVDKTKFTLISQIANDKAYILLKGRIVSIDIVGKGANTRMTAIFKDESAQMELVWFKGIQWFREQLKLNTDYIIFGKPTRFKHSYSIAHPEIELYKSDVQFESMPFYPMYSTSEKAKTQGLNSKLIAKMTQSLLFEISEKLEETLPGEICEKFRLMPYKLTMQTIHYPQNMDLLNAALYRLKFEELFLLQLEYLKTKQIRKEKERGFVFSKVGENFNRFFHENLPFSLTGAQQRVIKEIRYDLGIGIQMNRLLQGDVGSGKTLVALMCMLIALDNGFQSCMMAPTEILAQQHFNSFCKFLKGLGISVEILTGSTKSAQKREIKERLLSGDISILVGTHALLEDDVVFQNLGFVVIDEQHRFGVEQRAKMWAKNNMAPHVLVMTATPIPRTLAMTVYGDLDCSIIDELPPGRKPIQTIHQYDSARLKLFAFMKQQIQLGRQVYVVYPLINESEKLDLKDLMDGYESIARDFPLPEYQISIVHGKMKPADKDYEMERFKKNITQIMVSTTVIEVGVDVPNASVMVIENAERFGLSQLHQLRGRVGRGAEQSFCILMTSHKLSAEGKTRIETMVRTNDGFEIADADLKLRGPGDLQGTQQSGVLNLKIADLVKDEAIIRTVRQLAMDILQKDPQLELPEYFLLKIQMENMEKRNSRNWAKIS